MFSKRKVNDDYFQQFDQAFINSPFVPGKYYVKSIETQYTYFAYDLFIKSFRRNAVKHLASLKNSKFIRQTVVFLIEQQSARLCIYENNSFNRFYRISEDKKLLQFIKTNLVEVDYLIFTASDSYEIIDLSKIDAAILHAKDDLDIRAGRQRNVVLSFYQNL